MIIPAPPPTHQIHEYQTKQQIKTIKIKQVFHNSTQRRDNFQATFLMINDTAKNKPAFSFIQLLIEWNLI